jgi:hypothetical protein
MSSLALAFAQISKDSLRYIQPDEGSQGRRRGGPSPDQASRGCSAEYDRQMSKDKAADADQQILSDFKEGMASWAGAVEAHKLAPPDANFSDRLAALAHGASEAARVCEAAASAGFEWPPARKAGSEPPYELRPGTGRRGPHELWQRFDEATTRLSTVAAGQDMLEVARAYGGLAAIAAELADAVAAEDDASARPRAQTRSG